MYSNHKKLLLQCPVGILTNIRNVEDDTHHIKGTTPRHRLLLADCVHKEVYIHRWPVPLMLDPLSLHCTRGCYNPNARILQPFHILHTLIPENDNLAASWTYVFWGRNSSSARLLSKAKNAMPPPVDIADSVCFDLYPLGIRPHILHERSGGTHIDLNDFSTDSLLKGRRNSRSGLDDCNGDCLM